MTQRFARMICTIGPSCSSPERLEALLDAGMDVARLNFSHGTHEDHQTVINTLRTLSRKRKRAITILQDLQGPKIRTGKIPGGSIILAPGDILTLLPTHDDEQAPEGTAITVSYPMLAQDLRVGDTIRIDDGRIVLLVRSIKGEQITSEVQEGGRLSDHKGVNLPGVPLRIGCLTPKDEEDLAFGLQAGVDWVALSFVRKAQDLADLRKKMDSLGKRVPIVSKIERPEAIEDLDAVVRASDAVMIARGDLGVEYPSYMVPVLQKKILAKAHELRVPAIVATEMLGSMVSNHSPSRAEASDVAHAIFDGADGVMLSNETASGQYPLRAAKVMDLIVREAEGSSFYTNTEMPITSDQKNASAAVIARLACLAAKDAGAKLIAAFTQSGDTARLIASFRPNVPIYAFSPALEVRRRCRLYWGVIPRAMEPAGSPDDMVEAVERLLLEDGTVQNGDTIVVIFGSPLHVKGFTNTIRLHVVGERQNLPSPEKLTSDHSEDASSVDKTG